MDIFFAAHGDTGVPMTDQPDTPSVPTSDPACDEEILEFFKT